MTESSRRELPPRSLSRMEENHLESQGVVLGHRMGLERAVGRPGRSRTIPRSRSRTTAVTRRRGLVSRFPAREEVVLRSALGAGVGAGGRDGSKAREWESGSGFLARGDFLVSGSGDKTDRPGRHGRVWDMATGRELRRFEGTWRK